MEKKLVAWLGEQFGQTQFTKLGIGDDCAVLQQHDRELVLTCDAICEGVHFRSDQLSPEQIGRKALAVNLSDLASMGAEAKTVLVSLTLPRSRSFEYAQRLFLGMESLVKRYGIEVCGGDTNVWDGELVVSVTAIGVAPKSGAWTMQGAQPEDQIVVTGAFGGSILKQHWAFEPCLDFALQWRDSNHPIHACTDASDSLGIDLANLANASGLGFEIDLRQIPVAADANKLAASTGKDALHHALTDGEDFQLIMAVDPGEVQHLMDETKATSQLTSIGRFTRDPDFIAVDNGERQSFKPLGFEHTLEPKSQ